MKGHFNIHIIYMYYKNEKIYFLDGVAIVVCSDREDEERNAFQGHESEWPHAS